MRTSTPSPASALPMASATWTASVPRAGSGASIPPAASRRTSGPDTWAASSRTPAASVALCETMTSPTIALARAEPVRPVEQLDRMHRMDARAVLDLPAARLAVAGRDVGLLPLDLTEEPVPDRHRDLVLLLLQAVGAGDAAAVGVQLDRPQPGNQREEVERGLADPVALLLAGRVVRDGQLERPEIRPQVAALVEQQQELAEIEHRLADDPKVVVLDVEDLQGFALQHQPTAGRVRDDRTAGARVRGEPGGQPSDVRTPRGKVPVRMERQAAAVLGRHDDVETVVLEHLDRHPAHRGLVVVRAAGVKVDDSSLCRWADVPPRPALEGLAREGRKRGVAVDAERALGEPAHQPVPERPVRERRQI